VSIIIDVELGEVMEGMLMLIGMLMVMLSILVRVIEEGT
jgi:hypothetical protein